MAATLSGCVLPYKNNAQTAVQQAQTQLAALPTPNPQSPLPPPELVFTPEKTEAPQAPESSGLPAGPLAPPTDKRVYAVVAVPQNSVLNVRAAPGTTQAIVDKLPANARDLEMTGARQLLEDTLWLERYSPQTGNGWVSGAYIIEQTDPEVFCADPQVTALIGELAAALKARDGEALAALVSPLHGLNIRHEWWNPQITLTPDEVQDAFRTDAPTLRWGTADGSGETIRGSFAEVIVPLLLDVLENDFSQHCNTLEFGVASGGSAGIVAFPGEYANLNYLALYRAAPPEQEFDWRTWAIGIEFVDGKPYLMLLVQYHWEI
ncbi:MAG: hypothetical protein OHK0052_14940 [Anaerolineales bacterium]